MDGYVRGSTRRIPTAVIPRNAGHSGSDGSKLMATVYPDDCWSDGGVDAVDVVEEEEEGAAAR